MAQHVHADALDVLRRDVAAPVQEGVGFGGQRQGNGGAGRGAQLDQPLQAVNFVGGRIARAANNVHDVVLDFVIHIHVVESRAGFHDLLG